MKPNSLKPLDNPTFQNIISHLKSFWAIQGCKILEPIDLNVGAATFHPNTFFGALGDQPNFSAFTQASRRPTDGRYGENPNRLQHYYQFQVLFKPSILDIQEAYLASLASLGIDLKTHDVRFVEDNWESPTLGAWGLGWEVWLNGMEITQFTYFQQVGGEICKPVTVEIAYGLERLAMYLQNVNNVYDLIYAKTLAGDVSYGDVFLENEKQQSAYNFNFANEVAIESEFINSQTSCQSLCEKNLYLPAYERLLSCSHLFNLLDARGIISVSERARYIKEINALASQIAKTYIKCLNNKS